MNRFWTSAIGLAILLTPLAGAVQARASITMNWPANLAQTIVTFRGGFNVQNVRHYNNDRGNHNPSARPHRPPDIWLIQNAIRSNRALAHRLSAAGVNVANIVNAQQAANGNITFWLR